MVILFSMSFFPPPSGHVKPILRSFALHYLNGKSQCIGPIFKHGLLGGISTIRVNGLRELPNQKHRASVQTL